MIPLSILDLSVVTTGTRPAAALRNSIDLARHADALGYVRYWLAEHHNLSSVASPAPDLMIGQIAAVTDRIRVGSGGVMLPNHAPLMVAERFKMLEALFPGRIDLGLGRAPGTDGATAHALRSRLDRREGDDFLERLHELTLWETRDFPPGHPYNNVVAMPDDTPLPPIWLLGSSDYSSELAAQVASPVIELNRAVAVGMAEGAEAALAIVDGLAETPALKNYHLLPSVRGDLLNKLGRYDEACVAFEAAAVLAGNKREQELMRRRAAEATNAARSS